MMTLKPCVTAFERTRPFSPWLHLRRYTWILCSMLCDCAPAANMTGSAGNFRDKNNYYHKAFCPPNYGGRCVNSNSSTTGWIKSGKILHWNWDINSTPSWIGAHFLFTLCCASLFAPQPLDVLTVPFKICIRVFQRTTICLDNTAVCVLHHCVSAHLHPATCILVMSNSNSRHVINIQNKSHTVINEWML